MAATHKPRSLLDLTVAQVEAIEVRAETSFAYWFAPKTSRAAVYGSMLVELDGRNPDDVGKMTLRELAEAIVTVLDLDDAQG